MSNDSQNVLLYGRNSSNNQELPLSVTDTGQIILYPETDGVINDLIDVSISNGILNNSLIQYDATTNKWTNRDILLGNISLANNSTAELITCNNIFQPSNSLITFVDSNRTITAMSSDSNIDISASGNVNINASSDIMMRDNTASDNILNSGILFYSVLNPNSKSLITSIKHDTRGNTYIVFRSLTQILNSSQGILADITGNISVKRAGSLSAANQWLNIGNTSIGIGNTTISLGSHYAGINVSNSTGLRSSNLVAGGLPLSLIDDGILTNSKLANTTIMLGGRRVVLGGASNTIALTNMNDVQLTNSQNNDILYYNGSKQINSNAIILSNVLIKNNTDTQGICIMSNAGSYGIYCNYPYGDIIEGKNVNFITNANSVTRWCSVFHNLNLRTTTSTMILFIRRGGVTSTGTTGIISNSTNTTTYATSSDYRLKSNIAPLINGLDVIKELNPVSFNWNYDQTQGDGFIAHELAQVIPAAVSGFKDEMYNGYPKYQGVDTGFIIVYLVNAIQNLSNQIATLESEIALIKSTRNN